MHQSFSPSPSASTRRTTFCHAHWPCLCLTPPRRWQQALASVWLQTDVHRTRASTIERSAAGAQLKCKGNAHFVSMCDSNGARTSPTRGPRALSLRARVYVCPMLGCTGSVVASTVASQ